MRRIARSLLAALVAGAVVALVDVIFAGAGALAAAVIVALDVTAAALAGVLIGGLVVAASGEAGTERAIASMRALATRGEPDVEARRVAWLIAGVVTGALAFAALVGVGVRLLPGLGGDAIQAVIYGATSMLVVGVAVLIARAAARALVPVARRVRLSLRGAAAILGGLALLSLIVVVASLSSFLRAVDLRAPLLALVFALVHVLVFLARPRRPRWLGVAAALLAGLWLVTLFPATDDPRAVAVYRGRAPLGSLLAARAAALLDLDGDGYSAFLGDGDCAPGDARRNPGAREVPANGLDDDCFDGDLGAAQDLFPVPPPFPPPMTIPKDLSFVIILVDSLRADHLGLYGYQRATSPHLDVFAEDAVVFERAYAAGPYTAASIPAIHTGQHTGMLPRDVLAHGGKIGDDDVTLAEVMKQTGRATALVSDNGGILGQTGVSRGFDRSRTVKDDARKVTAAALSFIDGFGEQPFFLWVDYFSPHSAYVRHAGIPDFGDGFMDRYDHEIAFVDAEIAEILARLDADDLRGRVAVVILADHGEGFGEHGTYYHGQHLHEELVRVPLVMRVPGIPARRLQGPVSLIDVFPTLVNLARGEIPPAVRGHDLTAAMLTGREDASRHVFIEAHFTGFGAKNEYQSAVVTRGAKLFEDTGMRTIRLYDLVADPGEKKDLSSSRPELVRELRRAQKFFQSLGAFP